ncbi:hypothetical protein [Klebsiella pneumoniae]|uniref:hypothetical protein n=1 Tax=Klebsiella pneumoniae TaxID=573 RepID=UPI003F67A547
MTKSSITRDELNEVIATYGKHHIAHRMAIVLLAAMDSEPVAEVLSNRPGNDTSTIDRALPVGTQLYRHAQPAPKTEREPIAWLNDAYLARGVVDGEAGSEDAGPGYIPVYREPATQPAPVVPEKATVGEMPFLGASEGVYVRGWNDCRAAMLQENPKSAGESNNCRRSEKVQDLLAGNCRENWEFVNQQLSGNRGNVNRHCDNASSTSRKLTHEWCRMKSSLGPKHRWSSILLVA